MPFSGRLSVIIPVYRSEQYLEKTVDELEAALAPHGDYELVLVNDGSPDGVQKVIERLAQARPRVRYVELGANRGQHSATLKGFAAASGDVVVTVDDDGQNPPSAVLEIVRELQDKELDVVYGNFRSTAQHGARVLASRLNRSLSAITIGNKQGLSITNVRAVHGDLARFLGACSSPFPYIDAMIFRATRRIGQVPVEHRPREGASTYTLGKLLRLWLSHLTSLSVVPLKMATIGSITVSVLGFLAGGLGLVRALVERRAPEGWLSLFTAVTFLFGLLFAFLAILSTYVGRLYVAQNARELDWVRKASPARPGESAVRKVGS